MRCEKCGATSSQRGLFICNFSVGKWFCNKCYQKLTGKGYMEADGREKI